MWVLIALIAVVAVLIAVAVAGRRQVSRLSRERAVLPAMNGWAYTDEDDALLARTGVADAGAYTRSVYTGSHSGRQFTAFELHRDVVENGKGRTDVRQVVAVPLERALTRLTVQAGGPQPEQAPRKGRHRSVPEAEQDEPAANFTSGVPSFDERYRIYAEDEDFGRAVLAPGLVSRLLQLGTPPDWQVKGDLLIVEHGPAYDQKQLLRMVDFAVVMAGSVERASR